MNKKRALITGITGQDGSYLAQLLLEKGYDVHGLVRRSSNLNRNRIDFFLDLDHTTQNSRFAFNLHYGNLTDSSSIENIMEEVKPTEIYNLGAQSHVKISFDVPIETVDVTGLGTLRLLDAYKRLCPEARFYQASSSEMFGEVSEQTQSEETPFHPRSPYGCAKVYSFWQTINYRESYGLHASNGILFNHESERRGENFVTRKITRGLTRIKLGSQQKLSLGNLDSKRDWGYAKDFVEAMWLMLQQSKPDDYVIGTGETHSVREFLEESANNLSLKIKSNGQTGIDEKYLDENGNIVVEVNPEYFRPAEVSFLLANPKKAKDQLHWEPKTKFKELVQIMTNHDLKIAQEEEYLKNRK